MREDETFGLVGASCRINSSTGVNEKFPPLYGNVVPLLMLIAMGNTPPTYDSGVIHVAVNVSGEYVPRTVCERGPVPNRHAINVPGPVQSVPCTTTCVFNGARFTDGMKPLMGQPHRQVIGMTIAEAANVFAAVTTTAVVAETSCVEISIVTMNSLGLSRDVVMPDTTLLFTLQESGKP